MGSALPVKNYESPADRRLAGGFLADTTYGTCISEGLTIRDGCDFCMATNYASICVMPNLPEFSSLGLNPVNFCRCFHTMSAR